VTAVIVLVTNDDGVESAGITALARAAATVLPAAEIWIVAPDFQRSGCSHAMTLHSPVRVTTRAPRELSVTGTSADCVFLAVHHLLPEQPALVLSGINAGANLGDDLHYSGTAGAAAEAALLGIPALAASVVIDFADRHRGEPAWETAAGYVKQVIRTLLDHPLPGAYLNLNVPDVPPGEVCGLRVCRLGRRSYVPQVLSREDGYGRPYYWLSARHDGFRHLTDSDGPFIGQGFATLTPVDVSLTAESRLHEVRELFAS
jgi:5'-nucleotidase